MGTLYKGSQKICPIISGGTTTSDGMLRVVENGVYKIPTSNFTFVLPANATKLGNSALKSAFLGCSGIISADLSSLVTLDGVNSLRNAFDDCANLESVDFQNLTTISGTNNLMEAFDYCPKLTSLSFPSLTNIVANGLEYMVSTGSSLENIYFPALTTSSNISDDSFTNMYLEYNCTIHFPSNMESTMTNWDSMENLRMNGNTVAFDLPATT